MAKAKQLVTPAIRVLRRAGVEFEEHPYTYVEGGGTAQFAAEQGVDEHRVVKTLIMENEKRKPLVMLMHGGREVSTKALARQIGAKSIHPCDPKTAERHSGYKVGGTSPFGTRHPLPVYCEASIAELQWIYINGGKRGFIISVHTADMLRLLQPQLVEAAQS